MLSYAFTEEQEDLRAMVREFAQAEVLPLVEDAERHEKFPLQLMPMLGELGLLGIVFPEEYGGIGADKITECIFVEEMAKVSAGITASVNAHADLSAFPIYKFGTDAQKEKYLRACTGAGFPKVTAALVEPAIDFDPTALDCRAEKTSDGYALHGRKCFVSNGATAETLLVWAREGNADGFGAVQGFFVPRVTTGLTVGEKEKNMGVHALDSVELQLEAVKVPADARLGGEAGSDFERVMSYGRVALSSLALGVARAAYEHSVRYAQERSTWGAPIASRQGIAFMVADMRIDLDAARLLVWEAAWRLDKGEKATRESYLAKLYTDEMVLKVTDDAVMVMGGHGFIRENPVERWLRNARGFAAFDGLAMV